MFPSHCRSPTSLEVPVIHEVNLDSLSLLTGLNAVSHKNIQSLWLHHDTNPRWVAKENWLVSSLLCDCWGRFFTNCFSWEEFAIHCYVLASSSENRSLLIYGNFTCSNLQQRSHGSNWSCCQSDSDFAFEVSSVCERDDCFAKSPLSYSSTDNCGRNLRAFVAAFG